LATPRYIFFHFLGGENGHRSVERRDLGKRVAASRVEADGQAIGSYSAKDNSWEWAWNNPNIEERLKVDVRLVRDFGKKQKIEYLVAPMVPVPDEKVPTYLSAVAIKVIGLDGVFAGAAGAITVFLSLKGLKRKRVNK
jgi:uncharacterized protein DUF6882